MIAGQLNSSYSLLASGNHARNNQKANHLLLKEVSDAIPSLRLD